GPIQPPTRTPTPINPNDFPSRPVTPQTTAGTDPFSLSITGGLNDLITHSGLTPEQSSIFGTLSDLIRSGGVLPGDESIDQNLLERAREDESRAFTSQL